MAALRWLNLIFAILAMTAPVAHVLELPNKLALDGPLWLAVQQHPHRGWGPMLGGPAETGSLATTLALLVHRRRNRRTRVLTLAASLAYAAMIAVFFALNAPVNAAVSHWTPATLPKDWPAFRLQWETGHAIAALLSAIGLAALVRAWLIDS